MPKYYQGRYKIKNPSKYIGNPNKIVYRSGLELRFFRLIDNHPRILHWGSEEFNIKYKYEYDGEIHRYFPDLFLEVLNADNTITKYVIEIKPKAFCYLPQKPKSGRVTKAYLNKVKDYIKNENKWTAAKKFCEERNIKFQVFTEEILENSKY